METNLTLMKKVTESFSVARKVAKAITLMAVLALVTFSFTTQAQTPIVVTLGTVSACPNTDISIPINVENFNNVGSVSWVFTYDTNVLSPISCPGLPLCYQNQNPAFAGSVFLANAVQGTVTLGVFTMGSINLGTGLVCNLRFHVKSLNGYTGLIWDQALSNITDASPSPALIPTTFVDGNVHTSPSISVQPLDMTVVPGGNVSFTLTGVEVNTYQWQVSTNGGGSYSNLSNDATYDGVSTNTLSITNATLVMHNYKYRCVLTGNCPAPYNTMNSREALLTVSIPCPTAYALTGGGNYCPGSSGAEIGLANSETGVTYQLFRGVTALTPVVLGTGGPISFGPQITGTYTAKGTNSCGTTDMTGSLTVGTWTLPTANVFGTAPAPICAGAFASVLVQMPRASVSNPHTLVYTDGTTNYTINGITQISYGFQVQPSVTTTYTLVSITDTHCTGTVSGSRTITVNPSPSVSISNNGPLCPGGLLQLNSSGGLTYSWSGPAGFTSTSQNPAAFAVTQANAGFYTVTVTGANSCTATGTTEVIVNAPAPGAAGTISGPNAACKGQSGIVYSVPVISGASSYVWTVPTGVTITSGSGTNSITVSYTATAVSGDITVYGTNACGNGTSNFLFVNVGSVPTATAGSNSPKCEGTTVNLTSSGGTSYAWSGPNGFTSTSQNPAITNATTAASGTYTVTVSNASCSATATTVVVVNSNPAAAASNNGPVCAGQLLSLSAGGGTTYSWTGPNGFSASGASVNIPNATTAASGLYTVLVTNSVGCQASAGTNATVRALPVASAGNDGPACVGEIVNFSANGGASYSWTGPNGFVSSLQNPVIGAAAAANAGVYSVVVTGINTCTANATTTLTVNANPVADAGTNQSIASGSFALLSGSATGGSGNYSYSWSPAGLLVNANVQNPQTLALTSPATFTLVVTDVTTGCVSLTDEVTVSIAAPALEAFITAEPGLEICAGAQVQLSGSATGGTGSYSFAWSSNPAGFVSSNQVVNVNPLVTTVYTLVVSDGSSNDIAQLTITVNPLPVANAGADQTISFGTSASLEGSASGASNYSYSWTPAGLVVAPSSAITPTINLTETTTFVLTVTTAAGCSDVDDVVVTVSSLPLTVEVAAVPSAICISESSVITAYVNGGSGSYSYSWTSVPAGFVASGASINPSPSVTTTYFVAVNDGFTTTNGSATVTVYPSPSVFTVGGGGTSCGDGLPITLSGSQATVTYTLNYNGTFLATLSGTGSALEFGPYVYPGTYTISAVSADGCAADMTGSATIVINTLPAVQTGFQGAALCAQDGAIPLYLTDSENGVDYELYLDGTSLGSMISGNGSQLLLANVTTSGTYTCMAVNSTTGCSEWMNFNENVNYTYLPISFNVTGGGSVCVGGSVAVGLDGSEEGVNYTLYYNGVATSTVVAGTGFGLSFGTVSQSGTYTVVGINPANACPVEMTYEAIVQINANPVADAGQDQLIPYNTSTTLNGNGTGKAGEDYTYAWEPAAFLVDATVQNPVTVDLTEAVTFSLVISNIATGCISAPDQVLVDVNGGPVTLFAYASPSDICAGSAVQLEAITGGGTGPITVSWTSDPAGFTSNLLNPIVNPTVSTTYFVEATDGNTTASASAAVTVTANPTAFTVSGGGTGCVSTGGYMVELSGSELGVEYVLYVNGSYWGFVGGGTGSAMSFGPYQMNGTYTLLAMADGCQTWMDGSADILLYPQATILVNPNDIIILNGGNGAFEVVADNADNYQWQMFSTGTSSFENITDGGIFSGATAATLEITGADLSYNGATFRCLVSNNECPDVLESATAMLTVEEVAQTITTTLPDLTVCPGALVVPVAVENLNNVAAISLRVLYNPAVLSYTGFSNVNANLNDPQLLNVFGTAGVLTISHFSLTPYSVGNGTLVDLEFTYAGGNTDLSFDLSSPENCQYSDYNAEPLVAVFVNGSVAPSATAPIITVHPGNTTVLTGATAVFSIVASGNDSFQWEVSTDNGETWNPVSDNADYSGSTTSTLSVVTTLAMNGYQFRCVVAEEVCGLSVTSEFGVLTVEEPALTITTTLPNLTECPGTVIVPVDVQDLNNVAAISLRLTYNPAALSFNGIENVNANLNDPQLVNVFGSAGTLTISHFSLTPSNIGDGTLFNLNFTYNGGNSALTWDLSVPEACQYTDYDANPLDASFVNGSIAASAVAPVVVSNPVNVNVTDGDPASFTVIASGNTSYQWQVSTNNGASWTNLTDNGTYSGSNMATLSIASAGMMMDNYQFQCVVAEDVCNLSDVSAPAVLNVIGITTDIMVYAGSGTACPGNTVSIPVSGTSMNNVAAISLTLTYNPAVVTYTGYSNLNPVFLPSEINIYDIPGVWAFSWFSLIPINLSGDLMNINFNYLGGSTDLEWDVTTPGNCEFNDYDGNVLPAVYANGSVSPAGIVPAITSQPVDQNVEDGNNASFSVSANNGVTYQWQVSTDGSIWTDLTDGGIYSGTSTNTLVLTSVTMAYTGNLYQVVITNEPCFVVSNAAELTVVPPTVDVITSVGSAQACSGNEVIVPVNGQFLYNVAAISLTLNYDASVLNYTGYQNLNPVFNPAEININATPGQWFFSWFSLIPINLVSGDLLDLVFDYNGGNTDLVWNTITSGACEYNDFDGNTMAAVFNNGSVTSAGITPVVTSNPVDLAVNEGENAQFSVNASDAVSFQWQVSTDNGMNWVNLIDDAVYSGTNTSTLTLTAVNYTYNANEYRCVVSGDVCDVNSGAASLTVYAIGSVVITTAGDAQACPGNEVLVPVNGQYLYDVAAISLTLNYDPAVLGYVSIENLNPAFNINEVNIFSLPGDLRFSWFSLAPINLFNEKLFDINFDYFGGTTDLTWDVVNAGNCEYNNYNGDPMLANYHDGFVGPLGTLPVFTTQPADVTVTHGDNTSFSVVALNAVAFQWQMSTDGNTWTNVADGGHFNGATTDVLTITDAIYLFNNYSFRCNVTGDICTVASNVAVLTVTPVAFNLITTAGSVDACPGTDIVIPVDVQDFYNVAAISLIMNYDASVLEYTGYSDLNSGLASASISPTPGQFGLAWYDLTPVSLGDAHIINLNFHYNGGSANLVWDIVTPGYCEYTDYDGNPLTATFVNGSVNSAAVQPVVTSDPVNAIDFVGASASFAITATDASTYQWQVSEDGGNTWTDLTDGSVYAGATTPTLSIPVLTIDLDGNLYQCVTGGTCDLTDVSASALLTVVSQPTILTSVVSGSHCAPDLTVGIAVEELNMITDFNLMLNYDETQFVFNGISNVAAAFNGGVTASALNGVITLTYSGAPVYFGTGTAFELNFSSTGGSGTLSWDPASTYTNIYSMTAPASFTDGTMTIFANPVVSIEPVSPQCIDGSSVALVGTPAGGTFSGNGMEGNLFNPAIAGVGTHTITYTYTDINGCTSSTTVEIMVVDLPVVGFVTPSSICVDAASLTLTGTPAGGVFTGTGVEGDLFNPAVAGVGVFTLTYTYTDGYGCVNSATSTIEVLPLTTITLNPVSTSLDEGGIVSFTVAAENALGYQWQVSEDNGANWTNLADGGMYSGVNTATLTIDGFTYFMNGNQYQCVVSGNCPVSVVSEPATLTVTPVIITIAGTVENCAGQFVVPVTVEHMYEMASFSLSLNFDNAVLDYAGYQNVNPLLSTGYIQIGEFNNQVKAGFFTISPVNIGDGLLFEILFTSTGGTSALTWDVATLGNCEYQNFDGGNITSLFINGSATVNPLPTISGVAADPVICLGETTTVTYTLTGEAPWNVSWDETINGVTTTHSDLIESSPVVFTTTPNATISWAVTSIVDNNGCAGSEIGGVSVTVNPLPAFDLNVSATEVCEGTGVTATYTFTSGIAPWVVSYVLNGTPGSFTTSENPYVINFTATETLNYTLTSVSDGNGCSSALAISGTLLVHPLPVVSIEPVAPVCANAGIVNLVGSPLGGVFTGNGVSGTTFDPAAAGVGVHVITYTFTDEFGCVNSTTTEISVLEVPVVSLVGFAPVCANVAPFALIGGSPAGGVYTGTGVVGSTFNPALAGAGTYVLTYTYTNQSGCTDFATTEVTVNPAPVVSLEPVSPLCDNSDPVTLLGSPAGGTFTGNGVSGNLFNPAIAGSGTHTIVYTFTNEFGCTETASTQIVVNLSPIAFPVFGGGSYCAGGGGLVVALGGSQLGLQYHLYRDGVTTGVVVNGTGSVITFGAQTIAGTYTILGINPGTACNVWMAGSTDIIVNPVPTVYAGGYSIICQGGSAQLQATVIGGTAPFNYQWTPATGLSNPTIANPLASPNATAFYTVMITDANGCTDSDNALVVVNQSPVVNAGPDVTISIGTSTTLNGSATGGVTPYVVSWTPAIGLSNPNIMHPVASPLVTTTYTLTVTGANGCSRSDQVTIHVTTSPLGYDIYGQVTYDNSISSPLSEVNVLLKNGTTTVATSLTDVNGNYTLPTIPNGTYTTDGTSTKAWGGVNALDALKIARHFQSLETLTGLRFRAGDVDNTGYINANDALLVMQRAVQMISVFPVNSDWVFENNSLNVNGAPVPNNFKGLCYGDVNGSYIPPVKVNPSVALDNRGVKYVESFSQFNLPVLAGRNMQLGAASLAIQFPVNAIQILGVNMNTKAQGELVYNIIDGVLYVEWYSLNEVSLSENDVLFTISARSKDVAAMQNLSFEIVGGSEMGDIHSRVIENAMITMPKLSATANSFELSENSPNPFSETTRINYYLPENGTVTLTVYNHLGEIVAVPVQANQESGRYTVELDGTTLPQGVYIYKIEVMGTTQTFVQSKRMVVTR